MSSYLEAESNAVMDDLDARIRLKLEESEPGESPYHIVAEIGREFFDQLDGIPAATIAAELLLRYIENRITIEQAKL